MNNNKFWIVLSFTFYLCYIAMLLGNGTFVGNDSFFHARYSQFSSLNDDVLPWMYFTEYRNFFPNHHLLFHQILQFFMAD